MACNQVGGCQVPSFRSQKMKDDCGGPIRPPQSGKIGSHDVSVRVEPRYDLPWLTPDTAIAL